MYMQLAVIQMLRRKGHIVIGRAATNELQQLAQIWTFVQRNRCKDILKTGEIRSRDDAIGRL
jgi:hypothetical protein